MSDEVKIEVGSVWLIAGGSDQCKTTTVRRVDTVITCLCDCGYTVRYHPTAFGDVLTPLPAPVADEPGPVADPCPVTELRSGWVDLVPSKAPTGLGPVVVTTYAGEVRATAPTHDFSDPYCVLIQYLGAGDRSVTRRCKNCGELNTRARQVDPCEPNPDWRRRADVRDADLSQGAMDHPAPPRFQAPELRAAMTWGCDMVRGRR